MPRIKLPPEEKARRKRERQVAYDLKLKNDPVLWTQKKRGIRDRRKQKAAAVGKTIRPWRAPHLSPEEARRRRLERLHLWKIKNQQKVKEYNQKKYVYLRENSHEMVKEKKRASYQRNKKAIAARKKERWNLLSPEKKAETYAAEARWRQQNPDRTTATRKRRKAKMLADPKCRLDMCMSSRMNGALRSAGSGKGGRSWKSMVDYTLDELMVHLEKQFLPGMSWDLRGKIHIDHIRPLCSFRYSSPSDPEFKEAWALANLRPLWARDNIIKGRRDKLLKKTFVPVAALT